MALDPSKLKVAELKEQLILRGLDSKGLKAALVQRLQDAIDSEDNGDSRIEAEDDNVEESTSAADDHLLNEEPGVSVDDNLSDGISTHVSAISDDVNQISKDDTVENSNDNEPDDLSVLAPSVTTETGIVSLEVGADETAVDCAASGTPEPSRCLDSNSEIEAECASVTEPKPVVATGNPDSQDQSTVVDNNDDVSAGTTAPNKSECVETEGACTARESAGNEQGVSATASGANDSVCVKTESEFNAESSAFADKDDAAPAVEEPVESVDSGDVSEVPSVKKEDDDAAPVVEEAMESVDSGDVSEVFSVKMEDDDAAPVVEEAMESVDSESVVTKQESVGVECARSGVKRSLSPEHRDVKKANIVRDVSDEPQFDDSKVLLDWYNSDLSLVIDKETLLSASPMSADGFAYMWSGARATYGFTDGKFCFEVRLTALNNVSHLTSEPDPHVLRVGWSADTAGLQLGEEPLSFGYGGTGKFSSDLKFENYGCKFGEGDVVGAYVDFAADGLVHLYFTVNGQLQGEACSLSRSQLAAAGAALFPHVLTKNTAFELNMGQRPTAWFEHPAELSDYVFCSDAAADRRVRGTLAPATKSDCTVIMMVGLPSCGKTTWLNQHMKQNADKKFNILGTNYLIDRMRVMGLPRKDNYHGRWDQLIATCTRCLNVLLEMAPRRRRNYIIDQTNVYQSAQRRKLRNFDQFRRRAVVVVPDDEEFRRRVSQAQQQDGKLVPDSSVMEMKAAFKLPVAGDYLDDVVFAEQQREQAQTLVERYNKEARDAGFLPPWEKHRRRANNSTNTNNGAGGSSQQRHRPSYSGSQTKSAGRSGWQSGGAAAAGGGSRGGPGDRQWQRFSGQAGATSFGGWRRDADRYSGATAASAAAGGWWSAGAAAARPQQPLQPWATGCYPQQRWGAGSNYGYGNYSYREQHQQQYQQQYQQQQYQQQYQQQQQRGAAGYGQYGRSGWDRNGNQFSSGNNQQYGGQNSYNGHRGGYSRR